MGYMTDERRMIQENGARLCDEGGPAARQQARPGEGRHPARADPESWPSMGYFGIVIPEQYGGLGLGVFEYCLITEELARAWMSVA